MAASVFYSREKGVFTKDPYNASTEELAEMVSLKVEELTRYALGYGEDESPTQLLQSLALVEIGHSLSRIADALENLEAEKQEKIP